MVIKLFGSKLRSFCFAAHYSGIPMCSVFCCELLNNGHRKPKTCKLEAAHSLTQNRATTAHWSFPVDCKNRQANDPQSNQRKTTKTAQWTENHKQAGNRSKTAKQKQGENQVSKKRKATNTKRINGTRGRKHQKDLGGATLHSK